MKFHHIGIACQDLEQAAVWVRQTHDVMQESGVDTDELQNASFIIFKTKDGLLIELVAGPMVLGVLRRGMNLYHICYSVSNLDVTVSDLKMKGAILMSAPKPARLFENRRIAFLNTPLGIIELMEENAFQS